MDLPVMKLLLALAFALCSGCYARTAAPVAPTAPATQPPVAAAGETHCDADKDEPDDDVADVDSDDHDDDDDSD
jgi:hypothetical protein